MTIQEMAAREMERVRGLWGTGCAPRMCTNPASKRIVERAIRAAEDIYGFSRAEILSSSRVDPLSQARQFAMLLAHNEGASYPDIGAHMDRDHTTIMHGVKRAKARIDRMERSAPPVFKSTRSKTKG